MFNSVSRTQKQHPAPVWNWHSYLHTLEDSRHNSSNHSVIHLGFCSVSSRDGNALRLFLKLGMPRYVIGQISQLSEPNIVAQVCNPSSQSKQKDQELEGILSYIASSRSTCTTRNPI